MAENSVEDSTQTESKNTVPQETMLAPKNQEISNESKFPARTHKPRSKARRKKDSKKSLRTMADILRLIDRGVLETKIARTLGKSRQYVSYYVNKGVKGGLVRLGTRTSYRPLELTEEGKRFLSRYDAGDTPERSPYRLENVRFKAKVVEMPANPISWKRVEMTNWHYYQSAVDKVSVKLNRGKENTIEFIICGIDGSSLKDLLIKAAIECTQVIYKLESRLRMKIGLPELSSKPEFVAYDYVAKKFCRSIGQLTVPGLGKMNASKPRSGGELEFNELEDAEDYMRMGGTVKALAQEVCIMREEATRYLSSWDPCHTNNN